MNLKKGSAILPLEVMWDPMLSLDVSSIMENNAPIVPTASSESMAFARKPSNTARSMIPKKSASNAKTNTL